MHKDMQWGMVVLRKISNPLQLCVNNLATDADMIFVSTQIPNDISDKQETLAIISVAFTDVS